MLSVSENNGTQEGTSVFRGGENSDVILPPAIRAQSTR